VRALGVALASLALLDTLLAQARRRRAIGTAIGVALACCFAGGLVVGLSARAALPLAASLFTEAGVWLLARNGRRPRAALLAMSTALAGRIVTSGLWIATPGAPLDEWLAHTPFNVVVRAGGDRVAYVTGAALFLATAGNTLVRLLLRSVGSLAPSDVKAPGGGRVIGSIERVLIFGLAVGGATTAAALVISAKGVLRFAEVRATKDEDVDSVTEYVLVGSLASYALALAFVPFAIP
jgi:hypothetical protein